ncbi:hypothetical protein [Blastopirellula marina]|nr:hypothetical protein [Blastopirellula marina]
MIMGVFLAILSTVYMVGWLQWIARGRPGVIAEIGPLAAIGVLATGWSLLLICGGYGILFRQNWGRLLILGNCVFIGLQGLGIVWGSPLPQLAIFHLLYCGATAAVLLLPMHAAEFSPSTNEGLSL